MEKEIKQYLADVREFCGAVKEYFELKNKVLWESTTHWKSGSITVAGIGKYQTIQIGTALGGHDGMLYRHGDTFKGSVTIGYPAWQATQSFVLTLDGDTLTMTDNVMLAHNQSSNHDATKDKVYGILKIVGIDPIIPDALNKYIGGGYCIRKIGGVLYEIAHHLKRNIECAKDPARQKESLLLPKCNGGKSIRKDYNTVQSHTSDNRNIFDSWWRRCKHKFIEHMYSEYNSRSKLYKSMRSAWSKHDELRWRNSCLYARRGNGVKWCRKPNIIRIPKFNLQSLWEVNSNKAGKITPRGGVCYG